MGRVERVMVVRDEAGRGGKDGKPLLWMRHRASALLRLLPPSLQRCDHAAGFTHSLPPLPLSVSFCISVSVSLSLLIALLTVRADKVRRQRRLRVAGQERQHLGRRVGAGVACFVERESKKDWVLDFVVGGRACTGCSSTQHEGPQKAAQQR